jgi:protein-S-isoprenylcysteine O-methyltransferase Ste14
VRRSTAAIGTAAFFVVAPGTVVGLVPQLLTRWQFRSPLPYWGVARAVGVLLICLGLVPAVHAFGQFAKVGGTPAPIAPTPRLVVGGFNRYVRNPMYLGLLVVLVGQALLFGQLGLLLYAAVFKARHGIVCPLVRGTHAQPSVRCRVRGLPACCPRLVAAPALVRVCAARWRW